MTTPDITSLPPAPRFSPLLKKVAIIGAASLGLIIAGAVAFATVSNMNEGEDSDSAE